MASSGSKTPGRSSYLISIKSQALSAISSVSAATRAIGSPTNLIFLPSSANTLYKPSKPPLTSVDWPNLVTVSLRGTS